MGRRVDERRAAFGRLRGRCGRRAAVARPPGLLEGNGDPRDVLEARRLDRRRPERGRGVVQREDVGARGPGRRVDGGGGSVRAADRRPRPEHVHGVPAQRHHEGRVDRLELAVQERGARGNLVRLGVAVVRRTALDDVRDEDVLATPADGGEQADQELSGSPHERPAQAVLVHARTLAHEDDLRHGVPLAGNGPRPAGMEPAGGADPNFLCDRVERRTAFGRGHAGVSASACGARRDAGTTQPRAARISASSTAFVAAPLRTLSETHQKARPRPSGIDGSWRMRPT